MTTKSNPIKTFQTDWTQAKQEKDPNAPFCTLVTVTSSGAPASRTVGLREVTNEGGFLLFVNSSSPKWADLQANNRYELLIFWPTQMIQYRVRGSRYDTLDATEMKQLWEKKPHGSKLLDYYYTHYHAQSSEIPSRDTFVTGMKKLQEELKEIPFQEIATGLVLKPDSIEEWRGSSADRLHHRYRHDIQDDGSWDVTALVP